MALFQFLQSIVNSIWSGLVWLFGVARQTPKLSRTGYQIVHLIVVVIIAVLLGYFSLDLPGGDDVSGDYGKFVSDHFYGILFVLLYLFVRLVVFVVRLFGIEDTPEFPDIDQAWTEALQQLARQGLELRALPLFVIIGLPEDQERSFMMGAKFVAMATGPSPETASPLRLFANSRAAFLFVSGASAIVKQIVDGPRVSAFSGSVATISSGAEGGGMVGSVMTINPNQMLAGSDASGREASGPATTASVSTLSPGQAVFASPTSSPSSAVAKTPNVDRLQPLSSETLAEWRRRLRHVCRLINSARTPFCGINGLITVVPVQWAGENCPDLGHVVAQDVETIHDSLEMLFPVVCLFTGIESLGGLSELMARAAEVNRAFTAEAKAGSRFASGRPVDPEGASWVTKQGVGWFRDWVYAAFKREPSSPGNLRLYRLLSEISDRRRRFAKLVTQGFGRLIGGQPVRLLGVYFNGRDSKSRMHVFVKQLLDNVLAEQDAVAWSPMRLQRDESSRTWTYAVYAVLGLIAAVDLYLIYDLVTSA